MSPPLPETNRFEKDLDRLERVRVEGPTEETAETEKNDEGQTSKFEQVRKSKPFTREWDKPKLSKSHRVCKSLLAISPILASSSRTEPKIRSHSLRFVGN